MAVKRRGTAAWNALVRTARMRADDLMATPRDAQLAYEEELLGLGRARHRDRLERLADTNQAGGSGPLATLRGYALPALLDAVGPRLLGTPGRRSDGTRTIREAMARHLDSRVWDQLPAALCQAALKLTLDHVLRRPTAPRLAEVIGRGIYNEVRLAIIEAVDRDVWTNLKELGVSGLTQDHLDDSLSRLPRQHFLLPQWDIRDIGTVGACFLGWVAAFAKINNLPLIVFRSEVENRGNRNPRKTTYVQLHWPHHGWYLLAARREPLGQFDAAPMLVEPMPWTGLWDGGYLKLRVPFIQRALPRQHLDDDDCAGLSRVFEAVNLIQRTPWTVSTRVHDAARHYLKRDGLIEGDKGLPTGDSRWAAARRRDTGQALAATTAYRGRPGEPPERHRCWIPHRIDWRGRIYPIPSRLHFQRPGIEKALVQFAQPAPLEARDGYEWFLRAGAAAFGWDKQPIQDQVRKMESPELAETARAVSASPQRAETEWASAKDPWAALAWCFEWARYLKELRGSGPNLGFRTALPVQLDGSSNALQHYALLLRSRADAARVNLLPSTRPNDLYGDVAQALEAALRHREVKGDPLARGWLTSGFIGRDLAKAPTMTISYGSTATGRQRALRAWLRDRTGGGGSEFLDEFGLFESVRYIEPLIAAAIRGTVQSAGVGMRFLQECASAVARVGLDLRWTTPTGFVVYQITRKPERAKVRSRCHGTTDWPGELKITLMEPGPVPDVRAARQSVAPNFIHSLDASHLVLAVLAAEVPLAVIHDAVRVRPCDAPRIQRALLEGFVELYSVDRLAMFRDELVAQAARCGRQIRPPALPQYGDLKPEEVLEALFAFC